MGRRKRIDFKDVIKPLNRASKLISRNYESALSNLWKSEVVAPFLNIKDANINERTLANLVKSIPVEELSDVKVKEFNAYFKSEKEKHALHEILSLLIAGEELALYTSASLFSSLIDIESRIALSMQVVDEAKHLITLKLVTEKLYGRVLPIKRSAKIFFHSIANQDSINKLHSMNVVLEGFALILFNHLRKYPVLADLMDSFHLDESRHTALPHNAHDEGKLPQNVNSILNRTKRTAGLLPGVYLFAEYSKELHCIGLNPLGVFEEFIMKVSKLSSRSGMSLVVPHSIVEYTVPLIFSPLRQRK